MRYSDESYNLRIELDTKHFSLSTDEIGKMEDDLGSLGEVAADFPVSDLYITMEHYRQTSSYFVKLAIILPGRTLFTADRDSTWHPAYERCVRKLVKRIEAYKSKMSNEPEISKLEKGTRQEVAPTQLIDGEAVARSVSEGDYRAFHDALLPLEESVRKRVGRWVQRYPELEEQIGDRFEIADIVEEVFLTAFDRYEQRPAAMLPGDWLESLIDPSVRELLRHPDEELENVNMARASREA